MIKAEQLYEFDHEIPIQNTKNGNSVLHSSSFLNLEEMFTNEMTEQIYNFFFAKRYRNVHCDPAISSFISKMFLFISHP